MWTDLTLVLKTISSVKEEYVSSYYYTAAGEISSILIQLFSQEIDCIPTKKYSLKAICEYYNITPGK